jgi:DNA-binding YbaB/EbfC family protein
VPQRDLSLESAVFSGGGQPDLQQMLQQAQQLQQQLMETQAKLANTHVTGSAGGGSVKATVTGAGELVGLEIAPDVADPDDTETLADLVIAAVRDANVKAQQLQASSMDPLAQGLGGLTGLTGGPGTGEAGGLDLPRE